jgi:cytochrome oxidase Cu insertion factor (SCO1/SenC/PrrC family)
MKQAGCVLVIVLTVFGNAVAQQPPLPPNESETLGTVVPFATFIDENGDSLAITSLAGKPLIVSPIFTTCPHVCPAITSSLIEALDGVGGVGRTFNVLTLSFDPADTPAALRAYREKVGVPREWLLAGGSADEVAHFLDALDFHYEPLSGGGFAHTNAVVVLSPSLEVKYYLHGVYFDTEEVKKALRVAVGPTSMVERYKPFIFAAAALAAIVLLAVIWLTSRRRPSAA